MTDMDYSADSPYPARIMIKVIMSAKETEEENRRRIEAALLPLGHEPSGFSARLSGKGRWMSLSFFAEIESREALDILYNDLAKVPGTRMIL